MSVDKLYRCSARYCPGLPFDPRDRAHPVTCSEAPRASDAVRSFIGRPEGEWIPPLPPQRVQRGWFGGIVHGMSGQAEWPPKDTGERAHWPPRTAPPPAGTGPITDADVDAGAAFAVALPSWAREHYEARGEVADDQVRRAIATLTAERDEARAEVARLTAELAAAYELASVRGWDLVP